MIRSLAFTCATAVALASAPAFALDVTSPDYGGRVEGYASRLAMANARGERVRIGAVDCNSSCTLFLSARHSCVSPGAVFGFHAPWYGTQSSGVVDPQMTSYFASSYKPALRRLFLAHVRNTGHAAPGPLLKLSGLQLASLGYRLCDGGEGRSRRAGLERHS
jgi:hypothetical protein